MTPPETMPTFGKEIRSRTEQMNGICLDYRLYRSEKKIGGRFSYSLTLTQVTEGKKEFVYAADITRQKRRANEIFNLFSLGEVTACVFEEILNEII